jgi:hypothetical protein
MLLALVLAAAPLADVWPYAVKRQADGVLEYSYDLSAVKAAGGPPDAHEAHGDLKVATFLKGLPREVKVRVQPFVGLDVAAARGPEQKRPLATAYSLVFDGDFEAVNPLERKLGAKLRPALHPDEPKLLVGAEMLAWQVRQFEDSALAAAEVDTEWMRREVWGKVAERSVAMFHSASGEAKEGALALASRVIAANACLDVSKLSESVRADGEVLTAVQAEISRLTVDGDATRAPPPFSWTPELACSWVRQRVLGAPLEHSRAGAAAVLTFFAILEKDAKLKGLDARIRQRRDRFEGTPLSDRLPGWRTLVKGPLNEVLESLSDFISSLPVDEQVPPPLLAAPSTPFLKYLMELSGPERSASWDELASAVQDGRVKPEPTTWPLAREAALVPWVADQPGGAQFDSAWRDQRKASFAMLQGGVTDVRAGLDEGDVEAPERSQLKVRLLVPPTVEVEPMPEVYARLAKSLELLGEVLTQENLQGLKGLSADGHRAPDTLLNVSKWLGGRMKALSVLAAPDTKDGKDAKAVAEARRFVSSWRTEGGLAADVRNETAFFLAAGGERSHAAVVGVARREFSVGFSSAPKVEIVGAPDGLSADATVRQRYIVPVVKTLSVSAPSGVKALDRATVKGLVDGVQRDPMKVEGAIIEALHQ